MFLTSEKVTGEARKGGPEKPKKSKKIVTVRLRNLPKRFEQRKNDKTNHGEASVKKGLVPKTGFDNSRSFVLDRCCPTHFNAFGCVLLALCHTSRERHRTKIIN